MGKKSDYWNNINPRFRPRAEIQDIWRPKVESSGLSEVKKNGMRKLRHVHRSYYDKTVRRYRSSCGDARILPGGGSSESPVNGVESERRSSPSCRQSFYTNRFAYYVGECRHDDKTWQRTETGLACGKDLDKEYSRSSFGESCGCTSCNWIDEISLRKGHTYRIVVSDLERGRPIWYGGKTAQKKAWICLPVAWA